MKLRSPLPALGLFLLTALMAACGGSGGSGGGAPTIAPSGSATPTATTTPGTGPTASATISYPAGGGAVAMPPVSSFSGTINLTAASSGGGAQTSIATQAYSPAGLPVIQVKRRASSQANDPLLWISFTTTTALTLSGYPGFAITLPDTVSTDGTFSLVFYDPTHASLGWQLIGGPVAASGQLVTFSPGSTPVTFAANQTYVFAIYATPNAVTPSPTPTATSTTGPTPTPAPGAVAQLNETSFFVDSGFQPNSIVAASDGNLWFTECPTDFDGNGAVDKMTIAGVTTTYPLTGSPYRCPTWIVNGPDGALWFTETLDGNSGPGSASVGRIDLSGNITEYPVAESQNYLALGSDSNLWYTSGDSVYGFSPTSHSVFATVALPTGYAAGYLANNPQTNAMLVAALPGPSSPPGEILSFQPGNSPMLTTRYSASSNSSYSVGFGQFALGTDGNFYGEVLTNESGNAQQQLLQLSSSTYTANYLNLPPTFIFGTSTVGTDFSAGATVFMGGNIYLEQGLPRAPPFGIAEISMSGIVLGQANGDVDNSHAGFVSGTAGPDGNVWVAVLDRDATMGWIERIVPASSSGGATRVRR
jgi:hypothetical protein